MNYETQRYYLRVSGNTHSFDRCTLMALFYHIIGSTNFLRLTSPRLSHINIQIQHPVIKKLKQRKCAPYSKRDGGGEMYTIAQIASIQG